MVQTADLPLISVLQRLERARDARWKRTAQASDLKLSWRALFTQKRLHVLPGDRILELGAGSGQFSADLDRTLRSENPITAVVFSPELLKAARSRSVGNVTFLSAAEFLDNPPEERFDFVIGSGMLWHPRLSEVLESVYRLLKPGGQILFFEPNLLPPARWLNELAGRRGDGVFRAEVSDVLETVCHRGFLNPELMPHDIVSCRLGYRVMKRIQAKAVLVEHMPGLRFACASMCLSAEKPGNRERATPNLAEHRALFGAVSVVVPAHNEEPNIQPLVDKLLAFYGDYIHEIVIVNDNSRDGTADAVRNAAKLDPRVRLVDRTPPNGVGRALRDGYRAATGKYILSMDCDFVEVLPEFRGLFDAVARGHEGAIGSRFSHDSVLINYPFLKMFFNRICHLLIKAFLLDRVRDVSNNLKLYRAEILRGLEIESPHFAANLETGLKPLLAGRDITEVPISWINRTPQMGSSTFHLRAVSSDYARALYRCWRSSHSKEGSVALMVRGALTRIGRSSGHSSQ
jgi:SAM-dependent methyltransferase